jgi:N6-L-threonylcarbamoyladenine synthase
MITLGLESSCDETAVALVDDAFQVLANVVYSQIASHQPFGGVVPEIASRCHVEALPNVIHQAFEESGRTWADIGQIAVTRGPGLASSLLVGLHAARAMSLRTGKPLIGVNHLLGHVYSLFLNRGQEGAPLPELPMLVLLVSGGHTMLLRMEEDQQLHLLGQTLDDAAGEALDKGSKLMGLGYPGGPQIEKIARGVDEGDRYPFHINQKLKASRRTGDLNPGLCFSFSGLKTALLYTLKDQPDLLSDASRPALCAGYQEAVFTNLLSPVRRALREGGWKTFACVGGVARNQRLRALLDTAAASAGVPLVMAEPEFCTDNAAMIAGAAVAGAAGEPLSGPLDVRPSWQNLLQLSAGSQHRQGCRCHFEKRAVSAG